MRARARCAAPRPSAGAMECAADRLCGREPVVCIDEKPVVLHADCPLPAPHEAWRVARRDYEHRRCGTANAFSGVHPKAGRHFIKVTPDRSARPSLTIICWTSPGTIRRPIPSIWCWTT